MEDKAIRQEINTNAFVNSMEHPKNEEIKNELESAFKSKFIPEEMKEIIKAKFYDNIINNKKEYGEEYDRYLVNLLTKKRKDYKYLQAIFLIINNSKKLEVLRKEGIYNDKEDEKQNEINDIPFDEENWFIEIQIDLVFNDNHYYHKYVKKIIFELFEIVDNNFLLKYIKKEFIKKGEFYYKNNSEEFLSGIISLFEKLNSLTKIVDENKPKRKKRNKKKNKNKNLNADDKNKNNGDDNENDNDNDIDNTDINLAIKDKDNSINDNNDDYNKNINKINNNNISDIKEDNSTNNNKIDNQNKNKIWLKDLKLNREELELGNNKYDKSLKNEEKKLNYPNEIESPQICKDFKSKIEIEKFIDLEKQINELRNKNEIQANQISQCQEDISKLKKENEQLKDKLNKTQYITNIFVYKRLSNFILKKIINKYNDKLKVEKTDKNIIISFTEDINEIKINDLNKFVSKISNLNQNNFNYKNLKEIFYHEDNDRKLDQNIIEKLFSEEEIEQFFLFEDDIEIQNLINDKINKK